MTTFGELKVGTKFHFQGQLFEKTADTGMFISICNARCLDDGFLCHLEFKCKVQLLN